MAETFYNSIDLNAVGRVDFNMFKKAILKDKTLLEFFSLIINGMSDGFIQKNIERLKLQIFLNKISTIQQDVELIKELMKELVGLLPAEFQYNAKEQDPKFLRKSTLLNELHHIGESRRRRPLSKKIDKKVLEDDGDNLQPPSARDIHLVVKVDVPKPSLDESQMIKSKESSISENDNMQLKSLLAIPVDSFNGDSEALDQMEPLPGKLPQKKTIADNMISTPKLNKLVSNRFLRKTTLMSTSLDNSEAEASLTRHIMSKLDTVYSKLNTLKNNLSDNEGAIKEQIGSRMAIDVKKNMGVAGTEVQPKNKLLFILHDSWSVMASMMMGIQKSTNSLLSQSFLLKEKDFQLQYTFELRPAQVSSKDNEMDLYSKSIFYDYAPYVFKEIRQIYNISSKSVGSFDLVPEFAGS